MTLREREAGQQVHLRYLRMTLEMAAAGKGRTSPNPMVAALVVRDGEIVGRGAHDRPGSPHAEVVALEDAAGRARGATLYVNLEPCCHFGRTPPCVDRILRSGVRAVYACTPDPDPRVDGKGFETLRRAGLRVEAGFLQEEALRLNEVFCKFARTRLPFVTVKGAMSLDGKIATETGESFWITGEPARRFAHRLRFEADAILVGCGTVLRDDPRLTVRHPDLEGKSLTRVVLDSRLHCPPGSALFGTVGAGPVLVYCTSAAPASARRALEAIGVEVCELEAEAGLVPLPRVLEDLGRRGIAGVVIEGGSRLIGSAVRGGLVDKIHLFLAPLLIGGDRAPGLVGGAGFGSLGECLRLESMHWFRVGEDLVLEAYPGRGRAVEAGSERTPAARVDSSAGG
ncbi:MAG: bifunctional diaminohydroxyphosphoribosylaminopyrimidine deaminase/5-amino-6-(5-phosphoribosylamino)uracil reductase RibD [Acidobacteria bacterium]|nr:bifunctional diaminohydroxyphosphoribosylaminopyrimidine deaminase/5-amino-6-(5-phosphoribosylamino)uracil reductase RibD [Acidobacteriota bacterium]